MMKIEKGATYIMWQTDSIGNLTPVLRFKRTTCKVGVLVVRVICARGLVKQSVFGDLNPFCELSIGEHHRKTPKHKKGGVTPQWDSVQQFSLTGTESLLHLSLYHAGKLSNDLIGKCHIPLESLLQWANPAAILADPTMENQEEFDLDTTGQPADEKGRKAWFTLGRERENKAYAGQIQLGITFFPDIEAGLTQAKVHQLGENAHKSHPDVRLAKDASLIASIQDGKHLTAKKGKIKIFGGNLETAVLLSKFPVPKVVHDCLEYLKVHGITAEGIFRVPGDNLSINKFKKAYDDHIDVGFDNPHVAAGVLKLYFRELAVPLIPYSHYQYCLDVEKQYRHSPNKTQEIEAYKVLISSIPVENRTVLEEICLFLHELSNHESETKMTVKNLAIVMAPNIFRPKTHNQASVMEEMTGTVACMAFFIQNDRDLFAAGGNGPEGMMRERSKSTRSLLPKQQQSGQPPKSPRGGGGEGGGGGGVLPDRSPAASPRNQTVSFGVEEKEDSRSGSPERNQANSSGSFNSYRSAAPSGNPLLPRSSSNSNLGTNGTNMSNVTSGPFAARPSTAGGSPMQSHMTLASSAFEGDAVAQAAIQQMGEALEQIKLERDALLLSLQEVRDANERQQLLIVELQSAGKGSRVGVEEEPVLEAVDIPVEVSGNNDDDLLEAL